MGKSKAKLALEYAESVKEKCDTWMDLYNKLFGLGGKCLDLFRTTKEKADFLKSKEWEAIETLLNTLPGPAKGGENAQKLIRANGKVLVRMAPRMHEALLLEAEAEGISLNQLCMAKLSAQLKGIILES